MRIRRLAVLLGLCSSLGAIAQDATLSDPPFLLTVNPVALIDPFGPQSLRIGIERSVSPWFSIGLEAHGFYTYAPKLMDGDKFQGAGARLSFINWFDHDSAGEAVGLELSVAYKQTNGSVSDSIKLDAVQPYLLNYHLDRKVVLLRLCFVYRRHLTGRLWYESYAGLGARFKDAACFGIREDEQDARQFSKSDPNDDNPIVRASHACGHRVQPDLVLGVRIGLRLGGRKR